MKTDKITEKLKKTGGKIAAFGRTFRISFLLLFLALLTTAAAVFLSWRYLTNRYYLSRYEQGEYKVGTEERLVQTINHPEGYIPAYNVGSGYYKIGNYEMAEAYFRYALLSLGNFSIAAEANIGFGVQNTNGKSEGIGTSKMSSLNFSVAAVPVLLYQLNKHIALEANLNILRLGVNVNNTKITSTPNGGNPVTTKDDNVTSFILGANANDVFGSNIGAVTIGFTYAF